MDKDSFETKLREVRKQKSQVEEELESVSERWRAERRRLNSEIDRLEAALAEAKDVRRKPAEGKQTGIDPLEVAKMQAAADERIKKAEKGFEAEREKLRTEISRLQRAVAEQIERSNNPMRSTEPIKEQFQAQLEEAFKAKQQVEEEFYRARISWEEEKLKTAGEIFKLRRNAPAGKAIKGKLDDDDRAKELEKRLEETSKSRDALERDLAQLKKAAEAKDAVNAEVAEKLQKVNSALEDERARFEKELSLLQRKLAETAETKDAVSADVVDQVRKEYEDKLQKASSELEEERAKSAAETVKRRDAYERELSLLQRKLAETKDTVSADVVDQLRKQYEDKLHDIIQQKTQLTDELRKASSSLEEERARFGAAAASPKGDAPAAKLDAEVARVETMISEIARLIDDPNTDLSTVIRKNVERAELDAYLKGILFSMGRNRGL